MPAAMGADAEALNGFSDEMFGRLVELVLKFMAEPSGSDLLADVEQLATDHSAKPSTLRNAARTLILVLRGSIARQVSIEQLGADLTNMGLNQSRVEFITSAFGKQVGNVTSAIINQTVKVNELVDMQWKFGVTASNAEAQQVGRTFLQMKLMIDNGDNLENIFAELSLAQFYAFLAEMERANSALQDLK
eukprot:c4867_g1_i1.p1 GENE.c4867_g1_i1~~c4867_g1_i1.p1  ORF type:complete len:207 (+),score=50.00 c4867_g1_i1:54-623(+)